MKAVVMTIRQSDTKKHLPDFPLHTGQPAPALCTQGDARCTTHLETEIEALSWHYAGSAVYMTLLENARKTYTQET